MHACRPVFYFWALTLLYEFTSGVILRNFEYPEKSKIILFQGEKRFELEGKDCPVGVTFAKPERFSCGCVTGVWAFYDQWCAPPVKVVGGIDHCFLMPPLWIHQVMIWSNPLRVLDPTLTVFEGDEAYVKLKLYRNTHTTISNASSFVTNNSSWTLLGLDGTKLCLNSPDDRKPYANVKDLSDSFRTSQICHFSRVSSKILEINTFKPGCKGKLREVKPDRCENFAGPNGEYICTQPEVLSNFDRLQLVPSIVPEFKSRATTATSTFGPNHYSTTVTVEEEVGVELKEFLEESTKEPLWSTDEPWIRDKKSLETDRSTAVKNAETITDRNVLMLGSVLPPLTPNTTVKRIFVDFPAHGAEIQFNNTVENTPESETANNEDNFLDFNRNRSTSNPTIMQSLRAYHEEMIQTTLNLKREDDLDSDFPIQILQLLNISKMIMQRTCSLVPAEFFNKSFQIFLNVQQKYIQWSPPFIPNYRFQRILNSLQQCLGRAQAFSFANTSGCTFQYPNSVTINGFEQILIVDNVFESKGFEPIIESVWKMVVNAHSYCYSDFSHFYNDHHQYTTLLATIFTNGLYEIWSHNTAMHLEYNGFAGNVQTLLEATERCVAASRLVSAYPWNLRRPDSSVAYRFGESFKKQKRDLRSKKIRVQLPPSMDPKQESYVQKFTVPRLHEGQIGERNFPRVTPTEDMEWRKSRRTLNGLGFCLKKFDEPKVKLRQFCES